MPRKSRKNVGLIGLGIIGTRVAAGLRAGGYQVFVWNRTVKPAPNFLGSPAEVAEICDIIQLFVGDAQALFDVIDQLSDALTPQHIIICNATVGPEATLEAARQVEERGARFLDAPFTGSRGAAEKRDLVYYIGGDDATFLRARPVLETTSRAIVRIGPIGHAATIKVVTNMIAAVSIQVLGEALAIVQKAGLDPDVFAAALEHNACRSGTMDLKLPKMVAGNFEPHFSLKHMFKDVQLGIHVANGLEIEIPATTVTAGVMYGALNQGWSDLDFSSIFKVYDAEAAPALRVPMDESPVQIENLDSYEEHYPETRIAAPERPVLEPPAASDAPSGEERDEISGGSPQGNRGGEAAPPSHAPAQTAHEVPRLAEVLHAPQSVTSESRPAPAEPLPDFEKGLGDFDESFGEATVNAEPTSPKAALPALAIGRPGDAEVASTPITGAPESRPSPDAPSQPGASGDSSLGRDSGSTAPLANAEEHAANGMDEDVGALRAKQGNFVKRWFVARRGG